jgi:glycosyltransferase involved in cell wall biosynthesis
MAERTAHVALVGHRLAGPAPTGVGRYYVELATALASTPAGQGRRYTAASTREATAPAWAPPQLGLASLGGPRKARALSWALLGRPRVDAALGRPDLVHLLHPWAPVPTTAPLVATIHDLLPLLHPAWYPRAERWLFERAVRHVAERAALVIASSAHTAALLGEHLGIEADRRRVVWLGVGDELRRRTGPEAQRAACARHGVDPGRFLLAVGAVNQRKNLPVVLEALARTDPALLGATALLVAGPPGQGSAVTQAAIDRLGLAGRVRLAGFVPDGDLAPLLSASLALVHPSLEEGFGLTPLEAMAAGAPVVASAAGAIPEVVGSAALLVAPDDVDGWAAAIDELAADPDRRAEVAAAGLAHQAAFTWARTATETAAVHSEVLTR